MNGDNDNGDISVPVLKYTCPDQLLSELCTTRSPVVLRNVPMGKCSSWSPDYLMEKLSGISRPIHVTSEFNMNFVQKNFKYATLDVGEVISKASSRSQDPEKYYLRAVSEENPRLKPVSLESDFPTIADDFHLPEDMLPRDRIFSSVLRVSSGQIRIWTHYDVMDNVYCQIIGHKRAVLWSPSQVEKMYMVGDKSRVVDIDNPDLDQFPLFAHAQKHVAELIPGDILFIPALWFHNMLAHDFGVAVNVFWKELDEKLYDNKDPYGNKDHVPAAKAFQSADNIIKNLHQLPPEYRDFYCKRIIEKLKSKCQN